MQKAAFIIATIFALTSLYFGLSPQAGIIQQVVHLMFAIIIVLLFYQNGKKTIVGIVTQFVDLIVLIMITCSMLYLLINFESIVWRAGNLNTLDLVAGGVTIFAVLYGTKKVIGWSLPIIASVFILYAVFGRHVPGPFQHGGYSLDRIIGHVYLTEDGIFGSPLQASATLVIFFLIFSSFYERAGGSNLVIQLANSLFGWMKGGPAKVSVAASSLFGSISGSAVANVAGTGAVTIPLMKRTGYKPHFSGAVEAVSSTGGQFMPPIMGAAAFIMAEMLGISYVEVIIAAIVPAILYYFTLFIVVHLEAKRLDLSKISKSELPPLKSVLLDYGHMIIPLIILVYLLVFLHYSPARAALIAVGLTVLVSFLRKSTRLNIRLIFDSLRSASMSVLQVALACACAGIVVGVFALTGLGMKLSHILIDLAGGSLLLLLILTAVTSIILGMGMPTVGAYLVLAILIAPVLIDAGFHPIAAHLFIFYFGNMSNITPPVALASFAASGLAKANISKTSWTATRLAVAGFILPFMFIYNQELMLVGNFIDIARVVFFTGTGIVFLAIGLQKYFLTTLGRMEQVILIVASIMLISPEVITSIIGIVLGVAILINNKRKVSSLEAKIPA